VLIPPHPGLTSAFGALAANWRVDRVWTAFERSERLNVARIAERLNAMTADAARELHEDGFRGEPTILRSIDMRYVGQNYEREVALPPGEFTAETAGEMIRRFASAHDDFYGFSLEDEPVEFVNLRVIAMGASDLADRGVRPTAHIAPGPQELRRVAYRGAGFVETPVYRRDQLPEGFTIEGPAIIEEPDSTSVVHPADSVTMRGDGLLDLRVGS
jgi:N-methylhydantoinase A